MIVEDGLDLSLGEFEFMFLEFPEINGKNLTGSDLHSCGQVLTNTIATTHNQISEHFLILDGYYLSKSGQAVERLPPKQT